MCVCVCGLYADGDGGKSIYIPHKSENTEKKNSGFEMYLRKKVIFLPLLNQCTSCSTEVL